MKLVAMKYAIYIYIFACIYYLVFSTGCASVTIPDFKAHITLPASEDGYWVKTVSDEEGRIPKAEWEVLKKRGIVLLSEDWAILRYTLLKNCLSNECTDTIGILDELFYAIDAGLKKVSFESILRERLSTGQFSWSGISGITPEGVSPLAEERSSQ